MYVSLIVRKQKGRQALKSRVEVQTWINELLKTTSAERPSSKIKVYETTSVKLLSNYNYTFSICTHMYIVPWSLTIVWCPIGTWTLDPSLCSTRLSFTVSKSAQYQN